METIAYPCGCSVTMSMFGDIDDHRVRMVCYCTKHAKQSSFLELAAAEIIDKQKLINLSKG